MEFDPDIVDAVHDLTREWWDRVIRCRGGQIFTEILSQVEETEQVKIDLQVTAEGKPVPTAITLMVIIRAAIETVALTLVMDEKSRRILH